MTELTEFEHGVVVRGSRPCVDLGLCLDIWARWFYTIIHL